MNGEIFQPVITPPSDICPHTHTHINVHTHTHCVETLRTVKYHQFIVFVCVCVMLTCRLIECVYARAQTNKIGLNDKQNKQTNPEFTSKVVAVTVYKNAHKKILFPGGKCKIMARDSGILSETSVTVSNVYGRKTELSADG